MEFQVGQTYSGYEFLDILKRSKSGIEYRVKNLRAGRLEALRSLPESAEGDPERVERFLREMRMHAKLLHPNIVMMFSAMVLEHHLVMTTELVEGTSLAEKLSLGPLPWTQAVALIRQVLSALICAHREQIVHRDISPENITISPGGIVKLGSFSMAKGAASPKLTTVGMMIGNMSYISPEQVKGGVDVDARSDVYSVGMVLYEMLCGRPAFVCSSQFELMAAQVVQAPASPDQVNPAVPKELAAVILKALAKEPSARYQTAAEFDETLVLACGGATAIPDRPPTAEQRRPPSRASVPPPPAPGLAAAASAIPASGSLALSKQQLTIGVAAGTCLGVALVVLWFIAR
ncbi:MAG TPA: serine/threonine-protein kinase [Bryobacteraceae bacterium]|nr:serine/threonine-protein kinase [Bryobacteraceae bacterium]